MAECDCVIMKLSLIKITHHNSH